MTIPKAIAFDLDGTLLHTAEAHGEAYSLAFAEFGMRIEPTAFLEVAGRHHSEVIKALAGSQFFKIDVDALHERKSFHYLRLAPSLVKPLPTLSLLHMLIDDIPLALVTSSSRITALATMIKYIDPDCFDVLITADDVKDHKPSPEPYLRAAESLGIQPEEMLVFEDSATGLVSAQSAGCIAITVGS